MSEVTARFGAELEGVAEARRFCRAALGSWGLSASTPAVDVLVTELASNSVLHTRSDYSVTLTYDGEVLRVGVTDPSSRGPVIKSHSVRAMSGRGLHLVAAYAEAWTVEYHESGKTVWASLRPAAVQGDLELSSASGTQSASSETGTVHSSDPPLRSLSGEEESLLRWSKWAA